MPPCIPELRNGSRCGKRQRVHWHPTQEGGCVMPSFSLSELAFAIPLLATTMHFVLRLLPLVSDRVNARAVRLARAKNPQGE